MKRIYLTLAYGIVALGVIHVAATSRFFDALSPTAMWFASGGLAMVLTGALNLLNRTYGGAAPGLRRVCVAANVVMTAFALMAGLVGRAGPIELLVVVGLFGGASILSALPQALAAGAPSGTV